jgi:hypothetical protein
MTIKITPEFVYEWLGVITGIIASFMLANGIVNVIPFIIYTISCFSFVLYGIYIKGKGIIILNSVWLLINMYGIIIRI